MRHACILHQGATDRDGYGVTEDGQAAHRAAWEEAYGETIPAGLLCCHICDNPPCVYLGHLFLGTPAANQVDAAIKGKKVTTAKLTQDEVDEIRRLFADGVSQRKLGQRFNVNQGTISRVVNRKTWVRRVVAIT